MATYNGSRFIEQQLRSIVSQVRVPDEIVIADDGSRDDTIQIVRRVLSSVSSIAVVELDRTHRVGVTANFARGIAASRGQVVVLSDQDDIWHPNRLSTALDSFLREPDLLLHHSNARLVDAEGRALGTSLFEALGVNSRRIEQIQSPSAFDLYLRRNLATGATMAFRRSLFERAAPLPYEWVHDEWLAIIATAIGRIEATAENLIDYRQHGDNQIGVVNPTLRYKWEQMLTGDPARNRKLAERARVLEHRLRTMDDVAPARLAAAGEKRRFEAIRAGLPRSRAARSHVILRASRGGRYARYASQGNLDIARDLLQRRA